MNSVNLDLLGALSSHHADGRPKAPHAHHRAVHVAEARAARQARWRAEWRALWCKARARLSGTHGKQATAICD